MPLKTKFSVHLSMQERFCIWREKKEEKAFLRNFPNERFFQIDRALKRSYLFRNPYRISKHFLQNVHDEEVHQYGETPLPTCFMIMKSMHVDPQDHVFDLGAGRGRVAFFTHAYFHARITAVEQIPLFVRKGQNVVEKFNLPIHFKNGDYQTMDLSEATKIYLYGTTLADEAIKCLCDKFLPHQTIVTSSYPLSDYDSKFEIEKILTLTYTWGKTEGYVNRWKKKSL